MGVPDAAGCAIFKENAEMLRRDEQGESNVLVTFILFIAIYVLQYRLFNIVQIIKCEKSKRETERRFTRLVRGELSGTL